jgi:hypothetical protein
MDAFTRSPLPSMLSEALPNSRAPSLQWHYPLSFATAGPSATLSPSAPFPGVVVIGRTWLRRFRDGTRRASPVARRVLAIVPSLSPRQSGTPHQSGCDAPCCLRPPVAGSASGAHHFRGHLCVHSRYGPMTRSPSHRWVGRWAPGSWFSSTLPSSYEAPDSCLGGTDTH